MQEEGELVGEVTVVDVYDIASDIGKECEKIIDHYGADAVTALMPKVINALELLENLATKNERENTQLLELRSKISQLENDKIEKAEYRQKFEKVCGSFLLCFVDRDQGVRYIFVSDNFYAMEVAYLCLKVSGFGFVVIF